MFAEALEGRTLLSQVVYDPVAQFSTTTNPGTYWTYGSSTSEFAQVAPLQYEVPYDVPGVDSSIGGVWNYSTAVDEQPLVGCNTTSQAYTDGNIQIPANEIVMHPGPDGAPQFSNLLFTVPESGTYTLNFTFLGMDSGGPNGGTSTAVHVLYNGSSIFDGQLDGGGDTASPDSPIVLNDVTQGQTIDFVVGYGPDGAYNYDSTGLSATITQGTLATPTVTLSASANSVDEGTPVTLTANVSGTGPTPTGTVTFYYTANGGTTQIGSPVTLDANGNAVSDAISDLPVGPDNITAAYTPGASETNYGTASGTGSITVNAAATLTLTSPSDSVNVGQVLKLTASATDPQNAAEGWSVQVVGTPIAEDGEPGSDTPAGHGRTDSDGNAEIAVHFKTPGEYQLTASAVSSDGTDVESDPVYITVDGKLAAPKWVPFPRDVSDSTSPVFQWRDNTPGVTYELKIGDDTLTKDDQDPPIVSDFHDLTATQEDFAPGYLQPGHTYTATVSSSLVDESGNVVAESDESQMTFEVAEQMSAGFQIRVDSSRGMGKGTVFTLTIQANNDSSGNPNPGPPHIATFDAFDVVDPAMTGASAFSTFSTPTPVTVDSLDGPGQMQVEPSSAAANSTYFTPVTFVVAGVPVTVDMTTRMPFTAGNYSGKFHVSREYDNTLWPTT